MLSDNYKNDLVNNRITEMPERYEKSITNPNYDNYNTVINPKSYDNNYDMTMNPNFNTKNEDIVDEDAIRKENFVNSQNSAKYINTKLNESMKGHAVPEEWKKADTQKRLYIGLRILKKACSTRGVSEHKEFKEALESLSEANLPGFAYNLILCVKNVLRIFPVLYYTFKDYFHGGVTEDMIEVDNVMGYVNTIFITCISYWLYKKGKLSNYGFVSILWYYMYDYYSIINKLTGERLPAIEDLYNQNFSNAKNVLSEGMQNSWLPLQYLFNFGNSFLFNSHPYAKMLFQILVLILLVYLIFQILKVL